MSEMFLFIGGPYDGHLRDVPDGKLFLNYQVLHPGEMLRFFDPTVPPTPLTPIQGRYEKRVFFTDDEKPERIYVFIDEPLSTAQAFKKLLAGYNP